VGTVRRLSVAVVVNYRGDGKTWKPLSDAEMTKLNALVKDAVGYDAKRGDSVLRRIRIDIGAASSRTVRTAGIRARSYRRLPRGTPCGRLGRPYRAAERCRPGRCAG